MLEITKLKNGTQLTVTLAGRIDSITSPDLQDALAGELDGMTEVVFDVAEINYISSAGLRVILGARKTLGQDGTVVVRNASQEVREIFEVTNLDTLITLD